FWYLRESHLYHVFSTWRPVRETGDCRMVGATGGIDLDVDTRTGHKPARKSCRRAPCADTRPCGGCAARERGGAARHGGHRRRQASRCGIVKVYTPRRDLGPPPQGGGLHQRAASADTADLWWC